MDRTEHKDMIPVHVIGMGMSYDDLPPNHLKLIKKAEVLIGGRRHLDLFPEHPAEKIRIGKGFRNVLSDLRQIAKSKQIVVLASGDPLFFGIGHHIIEIFGHENVRIHPNITAMQAAFARVKETWDDARATSLHGKRGWDELVINIGRHNKLVVYTDPGHPISSIAELLVKFGFPDARLYILEDMGLPTEKVSSMSAKEAMDKEFSQLNVVVINPFAGQDPKERTISSQDKNPAGDTTLRSKKRLPSRETLQRLHGFGLSDDLFVHEGGLITKGEVRAVVLSKLSLFPDNILWDIGAGSGSVSIEASKFLTNGMVYAIEKERKRADHIEENRKRFFRANLCVVPEKAPDCLDRLPKPHRVFVGGGGEQAGKIVTKALERMDEQGVLVATGVLLETLTEITRAIRAAGWSHELIQIQISRSVPLGKGNYLKALNPVWIITATKNLW